MSLVECLRVALGGLSAHKMRSALTMLGIIIGVGAVIALLSVGQGVQKTVEEQLMGAGANLIFILPGGVGHGASTTQGSYQSLTDEDAQAIADPRNVPDLRAVAPEMSGFETISYGDEDLSASIAGVTPEMAEVRNLEIEYGGFIDFRNLQAHSRVVVLGSRLADELFPEGTLPIGHRVKIRSVPFRVTGVLKSKGGTAFGSMDDMAFVPLTTAQRILYPYQRNSSGDYLLSVIYSQVSSQDRIDQAIEDITALLRRRHDISLGSDDDFTVISQADLVSVLGEITGVLTIFLGSIAGISLLVGGIGIMNIMLVSVTERTREVGIRMAVGAKRRDILLQFLVEAVVLSLVGGIVGILLGTLGSLSISKLSQQLTTYVSPQAIVLATGFSIAVGLFFGIYPAARASRLDPIQALRYE